ncbi:hypothetical protein SLEP1_g24596 [Rubroshorea leprosula]|uniref:Uncharacterized protein n=1 Tax=Rubroshorea leprosula TaxID=152421 RepID=A0AAV5JJA7_9ROSI|nr:hypothetical protein SLEP1_g24594 [Rubroshorea leprosula]GKV13604.1 hypothetical protein SLEP1_g24596 [Rubroshorea leprosula]
MALKHNPDKQELKHDWFKSSLTFFFLPLEVRLEILDDILVQHEGLSKNIRINGWIDLKTEFCNYDCAWILATQTRKGNSRSFPYVGLEVNQTNRENKYISLVQHFGEETVTILIR